MTTQAITAVRSNCKELKNAAVSAEWLPDTLVPGSMSGGLFGLRYTIPSPESPCNCFSLGALHSRRRGNWRAMKMAKTLFPNCKMPHCSFTSYTHAEYNCYTKATQETVEILIGTLFRADVVTAAQTAQSMCFSCSLSTAREIVDTGVIRMSVFINGQKWIVENTPWDGINTELGERMVVLCCFNPSLHRFLTSATVHQLTASFIDEARTVEALTAFNRLYMDHCWTTGALEADMSLNGIECRSAFGILLPFTARELIEPLQVELSCTQLFGMHCRGLVGHCILTVNHLQLMHEDVYTDCTWKSIYTDDPLPLKRKKTKFTVQDETDRTDLTGKVNVEITALPISTDGVTLTIAGSNSD